MSPGGRRADSEPMTRQPTTGQPTTRDSARVVAISWIPSEAVKGSMKLPFELGVAHYDEPLPDVLGDLEEWQADDRFRFANDLTAWIEVEDGAISDFGQGGGGILGSTT